MTPRPAADRGRQAERTLLSWRRTALVVLGCSLITARAAEPTSLLAATSVSIGIVTSFYMFRASARRHATNLAAISGASPRFAAHIGQTTLNTAIAASSFGALGAAVLALI
ncbi:DUF202 domain-containing protein [Microbacterium sulfonylureivorans]|uniref:DUF202 domain-containing protein n=1 Tax=Microbacterium sulfonylureivorans TaxID=2486854 RepID=UPI000FD75AAF|nr:DUF202 domain-containing protein [Microbacterium sulfonylureivorans]